MKRILLSNLFILLLSAGAFAQLKVGYMNPQKALSSLPEYEAALNQVNTLLTQRDAELTSDANSLQTQVTEYQEIAASLNDQQRLATETQLDSLNQAYLAKRQSFQDEIQTRRAQLLQPIIAKVNSALEAVAEELKLDIVLNQQTSVGDSIIYYTSDDQLDITDQVVAKVLEQ